MKGSGSGKERTKRERERRERERERELCCLFDLVLRNDDATTLCFERRMVCR